MFESASYGYPMNSQFDRRELQRLLEKFHAVVKREQDKSLAAKLKQDLIPTKSPVLRKATLLQLAKWCKTENLVCRDGMDVAEKISMLLFGRIIDRKRLGV